MTRDAMLAAVARDRAEIDRAGNGPAVVPLSPMSGIYVSMVTVSALAAAARLGLFEALARAPLAPHVLARELGVSEVGLERLADFLVETGHLERRRNLLRNAPETMRWFTAGGHANYGAGLAWMTDASAILADLPDAIRNGEPARSLWERMTERPELGERFSRYMQAFASHISSDVLTVIDRSARPKRLLDLGGSHGDHAIAFCKRFPDLTAVIVDYETALGKTRARIEAEGLSGRIAVRAGDIRTCDWNDGYDLALYLSVAHNLTLDENRTIFSRLADAVRPGGQVVVHDYPREAVPKLFDAAFRLTLLAETGTGTLRYAELAAMLSEAGFLTHRIMGLAPADLGTLVVARRT